MQELETLLTSLIEEGWKPWGIDWDDIELLTLDMNSKNIYIWYMDYSNPEEEHYDQKFKTFRELVSLESGLWQFVCDRSLLKSIWKSRAKEPSMSALGFKSEVLALSFEPEYRLLESALIPEEELGKFLIDNIKVEWNQISTPETK